VSFNFGVVIRSVYWEGGRRTALRRIEGQMLWWCEDDRCISRSWPLLGCVISGDEPL